MGPRANGIPCDRGLASTNLNGGLSPPQVAPARVPTTSGPELFAAAPAIASRREISMKFRTGILAAAIGGLLASQAFATEIVTKREIDNGVLTTESLIKVADNGIFLLDTSSSTEDVYPASGKSIVVTTKEELNNRNTWFPDLGHRIGIYT